MTLGTHQDPSISAPDSAADDATLDIVRLLIETEARHAEAHPEQAGEAQGDAGAKLAAGRVAPRRVRFAGQPGERRADAVSRGVSSDREQAQLFEDLRLRSFFRGGFERFAAFGRYLRPNALQGRVKFDKEQMVQYGKLAGLVALALVMLFKPWLIPALLFMLAWLALIVFLLLGSSRISELSKAVWGWYRGKRSERAQAILVALQGAADRVDGILARLPARVSDGIYTPDLGRSARDMARTGQGLPQGDPFERLALRPEPAE